MYYWNDSAYIRKESDKLVLKGLKSRVIIKLSDLSPTLAKQLIKQDRIDDATLEARERRFLKRLNELGFFQTENYELESSHSRTIRFLSYFSTSPLALFKQINSDS